MTDENVFEDVVVEKKRLWLLTYRGHLRVRSFNIPLPLFLFLFLLLVLLVLLVLLTLPVRFALQEMGQV